MDYQTDEKGYRYVDVEVDKAFAEGGTIRVSEPTTEQVVEFLDDVDDDSPLIYELVALTTDLTIERVRKLPYRISAALFAPSRALTGIGQGVRDEAGKGSGPTRSSAKSTRSRSKSASPTSSG